MFHPLRFFFLTFLIATTVGGCRTVGENVKDVNEITQFIEASSVCEVTSSKVTIRNGDKSGSVEIKDCDVPDAIAEADRLNQKLLTDVPSYKELDGFTFVFINGSVRQTIEYKDGQRDKN